LAQSSNKRKLHNVISPPPKKRPKRNKQNGNDDDDDTTIVSQLLKYQCPGVQGQRYCLYQLVNLTQIDDKSPVYKYSVRKLVDLLTLDGRCVASISTVYRRTQLYNNDNRNFQTLVMRVWSKEDPQWCQNLISQV
jgi:hypothetical protein